MGGSAFILASDFGKPSPPPIQIQYLGLGKRERLNCRGFRHFDHSFHSVPEEQIGFLLIRS